MKEIIRRLRRISLFQRFQDDPAALEKIASGFRIRNYPPQAYILHEGESGTDMFILNRGTVRVEKRTLSDDKFTVVNLRDDMDVFFGEIALLDSDVRSASVLALTPVECYIIHKEDFEHLCEANPRIGYYVIREIAKSLAGRLRKTTADSAALIAALIHEDETPQDVSYFPAARRHPAKFKPRP